MDFVGLVKSRSFYIVFQIMKVGYYFKKLQATATSFFISSCFT